MDASGHSGIEPSPVPTSLEDLREQVSFRRWRVYEMVCGILEEIESRIEWERLYDTSVESAELLGWGLFLEETLPGVTRRIRAILDEDEPSGARPETHSDELEDHIFWGSKQVESGMQQSLAVLSREMVSQITAPVDGAPLPMVIGQKRAIAMPLAEIAGKLRSDLRKFTAFLVAGERWSSDDVELVLFPAKRAELERGQTLKDRLVETMEGFQGSDMRLPISEVIRMWRNGQVLGQAALAEVDMLLRGLVAMLAPENRQALYVDSYYRLDDWSQHLQRCSDGLKDNLGDEEVEDTMTKEIAAVLDTETLAGILGGEVLRQLELPRDLGEMLRGVNKRALRGVELPKKHEDRILEIKATVDADELGKVVLGAEDREILRQAAGRIRGGKLVDHLRIRGQLPDDMTHLEHLHPLVLDGEDGLKTYLMLLYGQIQNRDLHLLHEDVKEIPVAEKRLAVSELEYRLSRLSTSQRYFAFEAVRHRFAEKQAVPAEEWEGLREFLEHLRETIAPRLERIAAFHEAKGIPDGAAGQLTRICEQLATIEDGASPLAEEAAAMNEALNTLASILAALRDITIVIAPPETEAEIEAFLDMLG